MINTLTGRDINIFNDIYIEQLPVTNFYKITNNKQADKLLIERGIGDVYYLYVNNMLMCEARYATLAMTYLGETNNILFHSGTHKADFSLFFSYDTLLHLLDNFRLKCKFDTIKLNTEHYPLVNSLVIKSIKLISWKNWVKSSKHTIEPGIFIEKCPKSSDAYILHRTSGEYHKTTNSKYFSEMRVDLEHNLISFYFSESRFKNFQIDCEVANLDNITREVNIQIILNNN